VKFEGLSPTNLNAKDLSTGKRAQHLSELHGSYLLEVFDNIEKEGAVPMGSDDIHYSIVWPVAEVYAKRGTGTELCVCGVAPKSKPAAFKASCSGRLEEGVSHLPWEACSEAWGA
jgi:hypothetical protein